MLFRVGVELDDPGDNDRDGDVVTDRRDPGDIIRAGRCFFGFNNFINEQVDRFLEDISVSR